MVKILKCPSCGKIHVQKDVGITCMGTEDEIFPDMCPVEGFSTSIFKTREILYALCPKHHNKWICKKIPY